MTRTRTAVLTSVLALTTSCQPVLVAKPTDGGADSLVPKPVDGADSIACAASGQSCAQSDCCVSLSDSCLAQGQDRVCLHAELPPTQGPACNGLASSTLDGVSFVFPDDRCSFTQAELAAGIEIKYRVVVARDLTGLVPARPASFTCTGPDATGLVVTGVIAGQNQQYCLCDEGRCDIGVQTTAPRAGTTDQTFAWDGRNWGGPSDTNMPKGPPFPVGTYTFTLLSVGDQMSASGGDAGSGAGATDAGGVPFAVRATRFITVLP